MAEFFLELFSEEIPARMQAAAGIELSDICAKALKPIGYSQSNVFTGPRRIAVKGMVDAASGGSGAEEIKGPKSGAPDAAIAGFAKKCGVPCEDLLLKDGCFFFVQKPRTARDIIQAELPRALAKLPWPKSMRWGSGGDFTWLRPLRRIVCLLDGEVVPFTLGPVYASNITEGHRVHGKGPFEVSSAAVWEEKLREHGVIADQGERRAKIAEGIAAAAAKLGLAVAPDAALLDEVTGLVEFPVPLIGKIDPEFMELPWQVRELSMKTNQKYFALRDAAGKPAPYFAFVANLAADDNGAAIIAGNERVLRARLADARHFWALDVKTPLDALLPKLEKITFHAKIGTQRQRAERIAGLAEEIACALKASAEEAGQAAEAGLLCKADLVTGMVGEFPELQGIMGGYYAARARGPVVGAAISTHYQPKGPSDDVPVGIVAVAVALADKLDTLREFFAVGEKPTGSGDSFALRRAALGVIRIILENGLRVHLLALIKGDKELFGFITERLRVKLRGEGKRFDVLDAVLAAGADDDLVRLMKRVEALEVMLGRADGRDLLAAYKRAANILRIESAKDGLDYSGDVDVFLLQETAEKSLHNDCGAVMASVQSENGAIAEERFEDAMKVLGALRMPIDAFFENVTVNAELPELRRNRLRLLARFTQAVNSVAAFSRIEG